MEAIRLDGTGQVAVGLIGRNEGSDDDQPGVGEQRRHLADTADVFGAVIGREAQVGIEAAAHVVAVQHVDLITFQVQVTFQFQA